MMVVTAQDLKTAGIDCPILVGGAALSNRFTRMKIAPEYPGLVAYANDAMNGLDLANQIMDFERRESLKHVLAEQSQKMLEVAPKVVDAPADATPRTSSVRRDVEIPKPPDLKTHVLRDYDLGEIFDYINPKTSLLQASRLPELRRGVRGRRPEGARASRSRRGSRAADARALRHFRERHLQIFPRAIRRRSHRHDLFARRQDRARVVHLRPPERRAVSMPGRLRRAARLGPHSTICACSSPPSAPACARSPRNGRTRATISARTSCKCSRLEGAEAFAELLHLKIRQMWGIGDPPGLSLKDLVQAHYHGKRFSFGYPACPGLEDQEQIFRLLEVEKNAIGVQLTEGFMMDPESTVSADRLPSSRGEILQPLAGRHRAARARVRGRRRQARRQLALLLRLAA